MNEDHRLILCQYEVRLSVQIRHVKAETEPGTVQETTNNFFGFGVLG